MGCPRGPSAGRIVRGWRRRRGSELRRNLPPSAPRTRPFLQEVRGARGFVHPVHPAGAGRGAGAAAAVPEARVRRADEAQRGALRRVDPPGRRPQRDGGAASSRWPPRAPVPPRLRIATLGEGMRISDPPLEPPLPVSPGTLHHRQAAAEADLVLVIGTSANVTPAADIPRVAARAGAKVVEINLEPTGARAWGGSWGLLGQPRVAPCRVWERPPRPGSPAAPRARRPHGKGVGCHLEGALRRSASEGCQRAQEAQVSASARQGSVSAESGARGARGGRRPCGAACDALMRRSVRSARSRGEKVPC